MKNIVIVGGGSAGWMTAIALAARFPEKHFTVIDSSVVGPIGVGESVTGVVFAFVADPVHRLSLREFFRRCGPTFKLGIWYQDWQGSGTEYLGPIETPSAYFPHEYPLHSEEFLPGPPPTVSGSATHCSTAISCARGAPIFSATPTAA